MKLGWFTAAQWIRSCIPMIDTAQSAPRRTKQQLADWVAIRGTSLAILSRRGRWHWKCCGRIEMIGAPNWTHRNESINTEYKDIKAVVLSLNYVSNSVSHQVLYLMARMRSTSATPGHLRPPIRRATNVFNHFFGHQSCKFPPSLSFFHVRSSDHYVNNAGETTSVWFDRRCRIPHPMGGLEGSNWSANVRESLRCPETPQSHLEKKTQASPWWQLRISFKLIIWNYHDYDIIIWYN